MLFQVTEPVLAPTWVRWFIAGVSILMILISQLFQKKFSMDRESQMNMQMKNQELQTRMKIAKSEGNQEDLYRLNQEMMAIMKEMYKKQLIPMCIRSFIWIGLFGLLQLLFGEYDHFLKFNFIFGRGLISLYLLASLSFTAISILYKVIRKKLSPVEEGKDEGPVYDQIGALNQTFTIKEEKQPKTSSHNSSYDRPSNNPYQDSTPIKEKSWKDRLDE